MESGVSTPGTLIVDGLRWGSNDLEDYRALNLPEGWNLVIHQDRVGVCAQLNRVLEFDLKHGVNTPWFGFISDDSIVKTRGWDVKLIEAAGNDGFANSADDLHSGPRMHGAVAVGGDLLRAIGWWTPPGLVHYFCDDAWERLGRKLGNWRFLPDVMVCHVHPLDKVTQEDDTYRLAQTTFKQDESTFLRFVGRGGIDEAIECARPVVNRDPREVRRLRAQRTAVMICTPVYRDCSWQYTRSLVDTCLTLERFGTPHRCQMVIGNSNLPRARNELVAEFLATNCGAMIFIDSDMGWKPNDVLRLLSSDKEVIGGVGRKRCDAPNTDPSVWCAWFLDRELEQDEHGAIKVGGVGTGFLKIDRSVFEKIAYEQPERKRHPLGHMSDRVGKNFYDFFRFGEGPNGECIGEDFHFCSTWRNLGNSVWIDPDIELQHIGSHDYKGSIAEIFEAE